MDTNDISQVLGAIKPSVFISSYASLFRNLSFTLPSSCTLPAGITLTAALVAAAPYDIYAASGSGCVAAYSTVRSMYDAYPNLLY